MFIPQFLNEFDVDFEGYEEMKLTVGLYNPKAQEKPIILFEKKINIQPASINAPEIVYDEGWNEIETNVNAKDPFGKSWRWTTAKSVCIIENPKKECTLIIKGGVNKTVFQDQKLTFRINDAILDEFIPDGGDFFPRIHGHAANDGRYRRVFPALRMRQGVYARTRSSPTARTTASSACRFFSSISGRS